MDFLSRINIQALVRSRFGFLLLLGVATGGYLLLRNSQIEWETVFPYLLVGGCLLMHLFMPHGHGGSHHSDGDGNEGDPK